MNCRKVDRLLSSYIDERLDADTRATLETHLGACSGCQSQLKLLRTTSTAFGRMGPAEPPPGLAQRALRTALAGRPATVGWLERLFPLALRTAAVTAVAVAGLMVATRVAGPTPSVGISDPVAELTSDSAAGLDDDGLISFSMAEES